MHRIEFSPPPDQPTNFVFHLLFYFPSSNKCRIRARPAAGVASWESWALLLELIGSGFLLTMALCWLHVCNIAVILWHLFFFFFPHYVFGNSEINLRRGVEACELSAAAPIPCVQNGSQSPALPLLCPPGSKLAVPGPCPGLLSRRCWCESLGDLGKDSVHPAFLKN